MSEKGRKSPKSPPPPPPNTVKKQKHVSAVVLKMPLRRIFQSTAERLLSVAAPCGVYWRRGGWSVGTVPLPSARFFRIFPDLGGFWAPGPLPTSPRTLWDQFCRHKYAKRSDLEPWRPGIPATSGGQSLYTTPPCHLPTVYMPRDRLA